MEPLNKQKNKFVCGKFGKFLKISLPYIVIIIIIIIYYNYYYYHFQTC
jgi:hypothetical protein